MGDKPNESNKFMNQSGECTKSINEPSLHENSQQSPPCQKIFKHITYLAATKSTSYFFHPMLINPCNSGTFYKQLSLLTYPRLLAVPIFNKQMFPSSTISITK